MPRIIIKKLNIFCTILFRNLEFIQQLNSNMPKQYAQTGSNLTRQLTYCHLSVADGRATKKYAVQWFHSYDISVTVQLVRYTSGSRCEGLRQRIAIGIEELLRGKKMYLLLIAIRLLQYIFFNYGTNITSFKMVRAKNKFCHFFCSIITLQTIIGFSINGLSTGCQFKNVNIITDSQHRSKLKELIDLVIRVELTANFLRNLTSHFRMFSFFVTCFPRVTVSLLCRSQCRTISSPFTYQIWIHSTLYL